MQKEVLEIGIIFLLLSLAMALIVLLMARAMKAINKAEKNVRDKLIPACWLLLIGGTIATIMLFIAGIVILYFIQ